MMVFQIMQTAWPKQKKIIVVVGKVIMRTEVEYVSKFECECARICQVLYLQISTVQGEGRIPFNDPSQ